MTFNPNRSYNWKDDVRDRTSLLPRIRSMPTHGVVWPLIGSRRSGKTWTLRALEHLLNEQEEGCATYISLDTVEALEKVPDRQYLLLDEPQFADERGRNLREFLDWCTAQVKHKRRIILAMSPGEWRLLLREGRTPARVSEKDRLYIEPLTASEAKKLTRETTWAKALLAALPPGWSSNPYLLELLFSLVERRPKAERKFTPRFILEAVRECNREPVSYFPSSFVKGLDAEQREMIRQVASGTVSDLGPHGILLECGLVKQQDGQYLLADPVLEALVKPLKIHHISDVHFGTKAAIQGDQKESGTHGKQLFEGAGGGFLHDKYREYLKQLSDRQEAPHLLIVSGDIAETGSEEQFTQARDWLDSLRPLLGEHPLLEPEDPRILLVGGNHDVDWGESLGKAGSRKRHLAFARHFQEFKRPRLEEAPDKRKLEDCTATYPNLGLEVLLLGSAEFGGEPQEEPELAQLLELVDRLRQSAIGATDLKEAEKLRDRVARIDPGLVHDLDLGRVKGRKWNYPVNVAVLHHPVSPLPATEIARFSGLLNAGSVKEALLDKRFCLVLHGHMHSGWFCKEQWPGEFDGWTLRVAAAPSLGSKEVQQRHGFNQIEIGRLREHGVREFRVTVRRFERDGQTWVAKASMSFRPGHLEDEKPPNTARSTWPSERTSSTRD